MDVLMSWVGGNDLFPWEQDRRRSGPIHRLLTERRFARIVLLNNYAAERGVSYVEGVQEDYPESEVLLRQHQELDDPTNMEKIVRIVMAEVDAVRERLPDGSLFFHLSPGTPAMAVIWVLLSQTWYPKARLYKTSEKRGVEQVEAPVRIRDYLVANILKQPDRVQERLATGLPDADQAFGDIVAESAEMKLQVSRARQLANRSVPVLITGPSGTGKELFARAIHRAGPRSEKEMVIVNCGAIPKDLLEAELFGVKKGAYTGAGRDRDGFFQAADGGDLFLDELGELSMEAQVKLLRAVQQGEVIPVGANQPVKVEVRLIAATNRDLPAAIGEGRFREDLFYRLAVGVLHLPPLVDRLEDLEPLADQLLDKINRKSCGEPGSWPKRISPEGMALLLTRGWPGNVRQLENTLWRAAIWTQGEIIDRDDLDAALKVLQPGSVAPSLLARPLPVDLKELEKELWQHYVPRALKAGVKKTRAARLLGLKNHQNLDTLTKHIDLKTDQPLS